MRMRWGAYAGASAALAGSVIVKALAQRPNFYSATVYLSQSNANLMILVNFVFVAACSLFLFLQRLLYGPLRPIEIEQLYEKAWFAITETCLAMTIFRGEIGAWFLVMFFALLAGKVWGWIGEGRVEILEQQPPANPRLFHTRLAASLIVSVLFDTWMLEHTVQEVLSMARPDMMVMFGFEFAVLSILSLSTLARYGIALTEILIVRGQMYRRAEEIRKERREARAAEQRQQDQVGSGETAASGQEARTTAETQGTAATTVDEPVEDAEIEVEGWEDKGRWIFYLDLTTDFFKLVLYLSFFFILLVFYGLPIHIMRDVFLTCRSFFKRISDFLRYRTATKDMNERYPDATADDIGREDVCIICREEMHVVPRTGEGPQQEQGRGQGQAPSNPVVAERMRPKKLPCGHILHFSCLRSWLERQQICPTCRRPVVPTHQVHVGGAGVGAGRGAFMQGVHDGMAQARGEHAQGEQQHDQHDGAQNQNRARIFQFGPLRIGVGAGRGNMFEDLAQRIHDGNDDQPQDPRGGPANGAQQYGFGFGFGRPRHRSSHRVPTSTSVQTQLDNAERQIQQEINRLRVAASELNVIRMLQSELTRLHLLRHGTVGSTGGQALPAVGAVPTQQDVAIGFVGDSQQNVVQAGSERLPEGLVLPQGWSMMPVQRMQPGAPLPTLNVHPSIGPRGVFPAVAVPGELVQATAHTALHANTAPQGLDALARNTSLPQHGSTPNLAPQSQQRTQSGLQQPSAPDTGVASDAQPPTPVDADVQQMFSTAERRDGDQLWSAPLPNLSETDSESAQLQANSVPGASNNSASDLPMWGSTTTSSTPPATSTSTAVDDEVAVDRGSSRRRPRPATVEDLGENAE